MEAQASKGAVTDSWGKIGHSFSGQRWRFCICSFNFRQELKPRSRAIMNRA